MEQFIRQELLIGKEKQERLFSKKIIVFGIGGVGGYVCEILARAGVGNIVLVDFDCVKESNLNRQIVALNSTIGEKKIQVMKKRINDININCKVDCYDKKLTVDNISEFHLKDFDFVVDCIDDVKAKLELIKYCYEENINCISSMGTGNKIGVPNFVVGDISETKNDPLAKKMRKLLKLACIEKYNVVYSIQDKCKTNSDIVGSFAPFPAVCGCVLASFVLSKILEVV